MTESGLTTNCSSFRPYPEVDLIAWLYMKATLLAGTTKGLIVYDVEHWTVVSTLFEGKRWTIFAFAGLAVIVAGQWLLLRGSRAGRS